MLALALALAFAFPQAHSRDCGSTIDPRCPMFGDVNGDGQADRVWVSRVSACRFALVVQTGTRTLRAPLRPFCGKPSEIWSMGFPRVIALRPMNNRRGLEPEVLMWQGASNSGLRFFTVRTGDLVPVRIEPDVFPRDEWNVGGFAMAFSVHDCIRPHVVGVLSAWYSRRRWTFEGMVYRVRRAAFVRGSSRRRHARRLVDTRQMWPYVPGDEFTHCGGVERAQ